MYRASTQQEAEEKFNAFLNRLPIFIGIAKEVSAEISHLLDERSIKMMITHKKTRRYFLFWVFHLLAISAISPSNTTQMYNITGLQKLCDILLENPSWTIAHLMVFFNLTEHIHHSKVADLIDEPDYATNMTPIQVCRWTESIHIWKRFDHLLNLFYLLSLPFIHVLSFCHIIVVNAVSFSFFHLVNSLLRSLIG